MRRLAHNCTTHPGPLPPGLPYHCGVHTAAEARLSPASSVHSSPTPDDFSFAFSATTVDPEAIRAPPTPRVPRATTFPDSKAPTGHRRPTPDRFNEHRLRAT